MSGFFVEEGSQGPRPRDDETKARLTQKDYKRSQAKDRLRQVKTMKFEGDLCKIV